VCEGVANEIQNNRWRVSVREGNRVLKGHHCRRGWMEERSSGWRWSHRKDRMRWKERGGGEGKSEDGEREWEWGWGMKLGVMLHAKSLKCSAAARNSAFQSGIYKNSIFTSLPKEGFKSTCWHAQISSRGRTATGLLRRNERESVLWMEFNT